jgi:diguanylate cyclase (GGDEF)-like protein
MTDFRDRRRSGNISAFPGSRATDSVTRPQSVDTEYGLSRRISNALLSQRAARQQAALMVYRIQNYKELLETFGNDVGRVLAQSVKERLRACLRKHDVVEQIADDEFAIAPGGMSQADTASILAERLVEAGSGAYQFNDLHAVIKSSVGIAHYPADADEPAELLRFARVALRGLDISKHSHRVYTPALLASRQQKFKMEAELEKALEEDRFILQYQPQFAVSSRKIVGVEALVRMVNSEGAIVPPNDFIPTAEGNGFVIPLGRWVLKEACNQMARWVEADCAPERIAVNVSPLQLLDPRLMEYIDEAVLGAGIQHRQLELEITERCMLERTADVEALLRKLTSRGVRIAIDDFGTGYSSFAYLAWQPLDMIKMDRSFLAKVNKDSRIDSVVSAMIHMARELGLAIIAEGVETEEQELFLADKGCDMAQGFLLARPQDAGAIQMLLQASGLAHAG